MSANPNEVQKLQLLISQHIQNFNTFCNTYRLLSAKSIQLKKKRQQHLANIHRLRAKNVVILHQKRKNRRTRSIWTKKRSSRFFEEDVQQNGESFFKENFRMSRESFKKLCEKLHGLAKQDTPLRKCIPLEKRIAIALYALGSSAEYRTISNLFGVGKSTVCKLVLEFCEEVWRVMRKEHLSSFPLQADDVRDCVSGFEKLGFPQVYGAIDGCHIEVCPTTEEAIDYHNYKGWNSTVLFACVDYRYRFQYISVGSPGRCNDSQIFESSKLKSEMLNAELRKFSKIISGEHVPVVLLGDSAFRLSDVVIKPYPFRTAVARKEKLFNYYLSKVRRVVENAFGHLKARFRRIGKGIDNRIDNTSLIIKACCVLHNFLNENNDPVNQQWLRQMEQDARNNQTSMPEETVTLGDTSIAGQKIREAIASYLGKS